MAMAAARRLFCLMLSNKDPPWSAMVRSGATHCRATPFNHRTVDRTLALISLRSSPFRG
jgi:hypothetical protein